MKDKIIKNLWAIAFFLLISFWIYSDYYARRHEPNPRDRGSIFKDTVYTNDSAYVLMSFIDTVYKPTKEYDPPEAFH